LNPVFKAGHQKEGIMGRKKQFVVKLSDSQRKFLKKALRGGRGSALEFRRMRILLMTDANGPCYSDKEIAAALGCSPSSILNVQQRFLERGFEGAISRKKQDRPSHCKVLDGKGEAKLIALACSEAPKGVSRWTLRLLSERAIELEIADSLSHETVRSILKKANLSLI